MFDPRVDSIISELKRLNQHFCKKVKCCLGISNTGDPNLVLNQQGEWVPTGSGGDIQTLLSDLPEYLGAKEASLDGKPIGYWYYNTFNNVSTKVTNYISSFTAGTSTIDFTNNGGDDWDIDFKIATDAPPQLPSGCTIENYDIDIRLFKNGNDTTIDSSTGNTTDITKNTSGNGAGVYSVNQTYNVFLGSTNVGFITIQSLYKVDGSGNLLAYIKCKGITINSVNGLNISVTAIVEQSESYPIQWYSYNSSFNQTLIGSGLAASLTLPIDCAYLVAIPTLDSVFTADFPAQMNVISMVTIN